jgi:hypothetical protein
MSKSPSKSLLPLLSNKSLACLTSGLVMGQMVMGISAHHNGSIVGLALALVFVLSGGASIALFLNHRHAVERPRTEPAPIQAWLLTLGAAMILSIWYGQFL